MKELVVISGKGGTGKTSVVASFASLAKNAVVVDCDVDAADLHLILQPQVERRKEFTAGYKARIAADRCTACGKCAELCRFDAVVRDVSDNGRVTKTARIDPIACEGCGVCSEFCKARAITLEPAICGEWFISKTQNAPMVHARLGIASENSGKLVTQLRRAAQQLATEQRRDLILCDGSPGIGCPVIASLTGASLALFVVEPTVSGRHDFERIAQLTTRLGVPGLLAVNKADLNAGVARALESHAYRHGIASVGRIPYDRAVTQALVARTPVVQFTDGPAAGAIRCLWEETRRRLDAV